MKRLIALLLALLMVSSAVIAVSADGTGDVTPPTAPVIRGVQTTETPDANGNYKIRFLATVHSMLGDEVGFEIVANYSVTENETTNSGSAVYSKEEGDDYMASTTLYKSVIAADATVTLDTISNGDDTAIGICAAVIEGVPADADVVFEVNTYVDYEGEKIRSTVATAKYIDGVMQDMTGGNVSYSQDFDSTNSVVAATNAGIKNLYGGVMNPTIDNGRLRIPDTGWGNAFISLVGKDYFAQNVANLGTYAIEMDLDITKKTVLGLYVNGSVDDSASTTNTRNNRTGATFIQFVYDSDDSNKGKTISEMAGKKIYARFAYVTGSAASSYSSWSELYTIPSSFSGTSPTAKFKLGIVVDSTPTTGCNVHLFIDDTYKTTYTLTDTDTLKFDVHENSYVSLLAQNSPLTLDNLKVSSVSLTESEGAITGYTETATATPYSQTFDNDPVASAGVTRLYANSNCPSGLPIIINDAGQLQIDSHSWHTLPDYFATVIPATEVKGADIYKFEADVSITSATNFGFTLNNKHVSTNSGANAYLSNYLFVKFIKDGDNLKSLHITEADAAGNTGSACTKTEYALTSTVSAVNEFKFSVIVDSTVENACVLYLFINDALVAVHTTAGDAWDVADADDVSTIGIFAQDAVATIDNVKLTGVKKNN